jgi:hypothetical protein
MADTTMTSGLEISLAAHSWPSHAAGMFTVTKVEAAAIRAAFEQAGRGIRRCRGIAPTVPGRRGQRGGAAVCTHHRRVEAVAGAARQARTAAETRRGAVRRGASSLLFQVPMMLARAISSISVHDGSDYAALDKDGRATSAYGYQAK